LIVNRAPLLLVALSLSSCASTQPAVRDDALRGDVRGEKLDLHAELRGDPRGAKVSVSVENHQQQPIGIDLDAIRVDDGRGGFHRALGQLQGFRTEGGEKEEKRVAHEPVTVDPGARASFAVEFEPLPSRSGMTLVLPRLYVLGIDGQVPMDPARVSLAEGVPVGSDGGGGDGGPPPFFDPFVEW
jgi:hypothetical protein